MSVLVKQEGETARITLNRPERRNALPESMLRELLDAFEQVGASDTTSPTCTAGTTRPPATCCSCAPR